MTAKGEFYKGGESSISVMRKTLIGQFCLYKGGIDAMKDP